jgi:polysaccharide export outer membrane protein
MQPARLGATTWCFVSGTLLGLLVLASPGHAQTALETPQQTNDRIRALSASANAAPHDYAIGAGDLLSVEVFEVPELSRDVRVSQTGSIGLPLVPVRLQMVGLTETQAAQKIAEVLESNGLVSHPQVGVTVKEKRSKPITVVGAVAHPMVYEADRPTTLLEVLAQAGGIANDAGDTVIVTRPDPSALSNTMEPPPISPADALPPSNSAEPSSQSKPLSSASAAGAADAQSAASTTQNAPPPIPSSAAEPPPIGSTITVNLADLLEAGDAKNNILLQGGDIVTVPHAGIVYVLGAVQRPGGFVATNDRAQLTTLKILALAGGLSPTAKKDHAVIIRKDAQGQQQEVPVNLAKVLNREEEDVKLQPSDILLVPGSKTKAALIRAAEIGLGVGTAVAIYRLGTH